MDAERYRRAKALFAAACRLDPEQRRAFLDEECGSDHELRAELEALLEEDRRTSHPLDDGPLGGGALQDLLEEEDEGLPEQIGGYRIRGVLGRGGMGIVYLAEQRSPRREVALKVLPAATTSSRRLRMLEHEAEILARLQHRGIAQIFAAGVDEAGSGRPFFVMELVDGTPLDRYARERHLALRERLELVIQVCDAVQHAHQKGVVHRDLKPDNILVTATGEPKILDFGIARSLDNDLRRTTEMASAREIFGTLPYMSPEQLASDSAATDTRSDVYALGVITHELVAGRLPHDVSGLSLPEAIRVLSESEPARLGALDPAWRGDLETIVLEALAKEPDRRYASARELGDDLRRYLRDEAILARPPSTVYQLRKLARRHRPLVVSLAALLVLLVGSVVVTTSLSVTAHALEQEASENAERERTERLRAQRNAALAALRAARLAAQRGRWQEALAHYDEAEAHGYPDGVEIAVGRIEAWEGDLDAPRALLEIERLKERDVPREHAAKLLLLEADLAVNRLADADAKIELVHRALALGDENPAQALSPADREFAAALLAETGDEVLEHLRSAREHDPFHRRANEMYGNVLLTTGRVEEAREFARVLTTVYADDPAAMVFAAFAMSLSGGEPGEVERLWDRAREHLTAEQLAWLPLMFEAAGLLRRYDELQIDQLVDPERGRFGKRLLAEYGRFVLRVTPILARSRRAGGSSAAPRSGRIYFRLAPAVARAYRGMVLATFDLLLGMLTAGPADPVRVAPMLEALKTAETVLGDGMFSFGRGLYLLRAGEYAEAAERFARAARQPSIVVTPLAARLHELAALSRMLERPGRDDRGILVQRAGALVDEALLDDALGERHFRYLARIAGEVSLDRVLSVALRWRRRFPDSGEAAAMVRRALEAASEPR